MLKKITSIALSIALAVTLVTASVQDAEARRGRNAAVVGGVALGLFALGAAAAAQDRSYDRSGGGCYRGPKECRWVRGECYWNRWGDRVCERGHRECWRPTYCD